MKDAQTDSERDLVALVELLAGVSEECQRSLPPGDDPRYWALGFGFKLAHHAASALTLLREGTSLTGDGRMLDRTSLCVLARAGWETFLLFYHVFIDANSDDERELRWLRWSIESPRERQRYETLLPGQGEQLALERDEIRRREDRIRGNSAFLAMDSKKQKMFLREGGRWRPGWRAIGEGAGLAKIYRDDHYSYLCDHAHTGWFSVALLRDNATPEEEAQMRTVVAGTLAVAVANVIEGLWRLFPDARGKGTANAELVGRWVAAGRTQDLGPESDAGTPP